jgi:glycine dehydrogenase subunit 1
LKFTPHTDADRAAMLAAIGVGSVEELFASIPAELSLKRPLDLPPALSELEAKRELARRADANRGADRLVCFAGAGAYDHYIPAVVDTVVSRSEFYTAYTPYQAEVSQGTLQAIYEYQSLVCRLLGMEAANASMYDCASALAEAVHMACDITRRRKIVLPATLNPCWAAVARTYGHGLGVPFVTAEPRGLVTDPAAVAALVGPDTAAVVVQQPNFFGCIEDAAAIAAAAHAAGALVIAAVDPVSLGLLPSPGEWDADIAVAEGQSLGIPLSFGGPYLGMMATKKTHIRNLPGRIAARTSDVDGRTGYVLALQTREQHIRRERASSNICTNQALCALAASVYLSWAGPKGLAEVARQSHAKSHYLAGRIAALKGFTVDPAPFFKEFLVRTPLPAADIVKVGLAKGLLTGVDLGRFKAEWQDRLLVAVTEKRTKDEMDRLVALLAGFAQ